MTIQQEANILINGMSEDNVRLIVELIKKMTLVSVSVPVSSDHPQKRQLGIANGRYIIPDNIDQCNNEIAEMFGVAQ